MLKIQHKIVTKVLNLAAGTRAGARVDRSLLTIVASVGADGAEGVTFAVDKGVGECHRHFATGATYHHWIPMFLEPRPRDVSLWNLDTAIAYIFKESFHAIPP